MGCAAPFVRSPTCARVRSEMRGSRPKRMHVVIVGGGFAGVTCAKLFAEEDRVRVTLIDQNGYHQFQPLLYQVATAELAGRDMTFDREEVFRGQGSVALARAEAVAARTNIAATSPPRASARPPRPGGVPRWR
jgi:malic enzyme